MMKKPSQNKTRKKKAKVIILKGKGKEKGGKGKSTGRRAARNDPPPPPEFKKITPTLIYDISSLTGETIETVTIALRSNKSFQEVKNLKKTNPLQYQQNLDFWSVFGPYTTPKPPPAPPQNWFDTCCRKNKYFYYKQINHSTQTWVSKMAVPYDLELKNLIDHTLIKDFPKY